MLLTGTWRVLNCLQVMMMKAISKVDSKSMSSTISVISVSSSMCIHNTHACNTIMVLLGGGIEGAVGAESRSFSGSEEL